MILESSNQYFPFCRSTNTHRFKRRFKKIFSAFLFLYVWRKSLLWINSVIHAIRESENKKRKIDSTHSSEVWSSKREKFLMNPWENGRENELERKWKRRGGEEMKVNGLSFFSFFLERQISMTNSLTDNTSFLSSMTNYSIYETTFVTVQVLSMYFFFSNSNTLVISL